MIQAGEERHGKREPERRKGGGGHSERDFKKLRYDCICTSRMASKGLRGRPQKLKPKIASIKTSNEEERPPAACTISCRKGN